MSNVTFQNGSDFEFVCRFLDKFVMNLHGKAHIRAFCEKNKGHSFIDKVTSSDCAYVVLLLANNKDKWDQEIELGWSELPKTELEKYKPRNQHLLTDEDKLKYKKVEARFTSSKGRKKTYLSHGFNKEGICFFKKQCEDWRAFLGNKDLHDMLRVSYDEYCMQATVAQHWTGRSIVDVEEDEDAEDSDEEEGVNHFAIPGDEDFEGDRTAGGGESDDDALVSKTKNVSSQDLDEYMNRKLYRKENGDTAGEYDDDSVNTSRPNKKSRVSLSPNPEEEC